MRIPVHFAKRLRPLAVLLAGLLVLPASMAQNAPAPRSRLAVLHETFANNQFGRPLVLESTETSSGLRGDIYAIVDFPFSMVGQGLTSIDHWCDILILPLNVKQCQTDAAASATIMHVCRKFDQP